MSTLTLKQENFILKYFECGNASEAYRHAYSAENMKPEVIHVKASELLNPELNGKIAVRLEELRAEAQKKSEWNVQKLIKVHTRTYEIAIGDVASHHLVREGIGEGMSQTNEVYMRDTNLIAANKALVEIGKLIGAYDKNNKEKEDKYDLLTLLKQVAK